MKKIRLSILSILILLSLSISAFAGSWQQDAKGWWYLNDDRTYPAGGWFSIEEKLYYFDADGYLLTDTTTPDGYKVDKDGIRIDATGKPFLMHAGTALIGAATSHAVSTNLTAASGSASNTTQAAGTQSGNSSFGSIQSGTRSNTSAAATGGTTYILNTNTKKFHYPYCNSVSQMKDKNKRETNEDRDTIIAKGYVPCKNCNP